MLAGQNRYFSPSPLLNRSPTPTCFSPPQRSSSPRVTADVIERMRYLRSQSTSSLRNQTSLIASLRETRSRALQQSQQAYNNLTAPRANTASPFNGRPRAKKRPNVITRFNASSDISSPDSSPPLLSNPSTTQAQTNGSSLEEKSLTSDRPPIAPKYIKEVKSKSGVIICYEPGSIRENHPYVSDSIDAITPSISD